MIHDDADVNDGEDTVLVICAQHGATCIDSGVSSYTCMCADGYSGEYCDVNINDCDPIITVVISNK